jgi:hypothetical protein
LRRREPNILRLPSPFVNLFKIIGNLIASMKNVA